MGRPRIVRVFNRTRGCLVAGRVLVADTWAARRRGLLGRDRLDENEGLLLVPCRWVHGLGMAFDLDVVHLDRGGRVLRAYRLAAGRIGPPVLRGYSVLELAPGTLARTGTRAGDRLECELHGRGTLDEEASSEDTHGDTDDDTGDDTAKIPTGRDDRKGVGP